MFSTFIVAMSCQQYQKQMLLARVVTLKKLSYQVYLARGTLQTANRHQQTKQSMTLTVTDWKTWVCVVKRGCETRLSVDLEGILTPCRTTLEVEATFCLHCFWFGWGASNLNWGYNQAVKGILSRVRDLLNLTDMPSVESTESVYEGMTRSFK